MPTYEYRCGNCGVFEVQQRITEDPLTACPTCGAEVNRLISRNVNIVFKGSGFHITDYRSSGSKSSGDRNGSSKGDGDYSSDSAKSTSKAFSDDD